MHSRLYFPRTHSFSTARLIRKCSLTLGCLSVALTFGINAKAGTLYGATATGAAGRLYTLNPATGAMIQDIGPLNDSLGTNYPVTGLAFHPITGVLYGSTANSDTNTRARLITINPQTAQVTVVGLFNVFTLQGQIITMTDIGFDPNGNLFGISSRGGPHLYSISINTGQGTILGPGAYQTTIGGAIAISSANVIYSSPTYNSSTSPTTAVFGIYERTNGEFMVITNMPNPLSSSYGSYGAFSFDENGVLYGINLASGNPTPTHLFSINPVNGVATEKGASVSSLDAIAFQNPVRPRLEIFRTAFQQVLLRWPALAGFQLEYKTNLFAGSWLTNTTLPTSSNGTNSLTLPATASSTFFRLHKP
jgi:hypothetical protein